MTKLLSDWTPSEATLELLKFNGIDKALIDGSVSYLKTKTGLEDIDKISGYDSWDALFIIFCIKAAGSPNKFE